MYTDVVMKLRQPTNICVIEYTIYNMNICIMAFKEICTLTATAE